MRATSQLDPNVGIREKHAQGPPTSTTL